MQPVSNVELLKVSEDKWKSKEIIQGYNLKWKAPTASPKFVDEKPSTSKNGELNTTPYRENEVKTSPKENSIAYANSYINSLSLHQNSIKIENSTLDNSLESGYYISSTNYSSIRISDNTTDILTKFTDNDIPLIDNVSVLSNISHTNPSTFINNQSMINETNNSLHEFKDISTITYTSSPKAVEEVLDKYLENDRTIEKTTTERYNLTEISSAGKKFVQSTEPIDTTRKPNTSNEIFTNKGFELHATSTS